MGTVYEVEDTSVGRRYALKTLLDTKGDLADVTARLQREARFTAALRHRNIIDVMTAGKTADDPPLPYYVMELLRGVSLRDLMKRRGRSIPADQVHQIGVELLDGLYRAHHPVKKGEVPLVHCDLKPENIFIAFDVEGKTTVKILDFGIAAAVGPKTAGETFAGTPKYAAPEQFRRGAATPQTDLYAVACILYELLAGVSPFPDAKGVTGYARAHVHEAPRPLREVIDVPREVERTLLAALSKDPAARPHTAYALMAGLAELRSRHAVLLPHDINKTDEMLETAVSALGPPSSDAPLASAPPLLSDPPNGFAVTSPVPTASSEIDASLRLDLSADRLDFRQDVSEAAEARAAASLRERFTKDEVDRLAATRTLPSRAARHVRSEAAGPRGTERLAQVGVTVALPEEPPAPAAEDRTADQPRPSSAREPRPRVNDAMTEVDSSPWFLERRRFPGGLPRDVRVWATVASFFATLAIGGAVIALTAAPHGASRTSPPVDRGDAAAPVRGAP